VCKITAGLKQQRLTGAAYDAVVDEFMSAVQAWRPHAMVQIEDFGNTNAFRCVAENAIVLDVHVLCTNKSRCVLVKIRQHQCVQVGA
jgi:hypothetical protein